MTDEREPASLHLDPNRRGGSAADRSATASDPDSGMAAANDAPVDQAEPGNVFASLPGWRDLLRAMRPHQWFKNAFVAAPLIFAGPELRAQDALDLTLVLRVALAFGVFCLASSATYLLNDIHDVEGDRLHPIKRLRPIAAGAVPVAAAWLLFAGLLTAGVGLSLVVAPGYLYFVGAYFAMNLAYSKGLKRIAYVDAVVISLGFVLRILAGAEAASVQVSNWLVACTVLLAMFLALGKRKHELLTSNSKHRAALGQYRKSHLDAALAALAAATVVAYLSYTLDADTAARFGTHLLPWTVPFPILGLWRFVQLLNRPDSAHSPTERMLRDPAFLANFVLWAGVVGALIYGFVGGG